MGQNSGYAKQAAALARWKASKTPEQLREIYRRAAAKQSRRRIEKMALQAATTGVAPDRQININVSLREAGAYTPGSSRTFSITGCPNTPDEIRQALRELMPVLRKKLAGEKTHKREQLVERW